MDLVRLVRMIETQKSRYENQDYESREMILQRGLAALEADINSFEDNQMLDQRYILSDSKQRDMFMKNVVARICRMEDRRLNNQDAIMVKDLRENSIEEYMDEDLGSSVWGDAPSSSTRSFFEQTPAASSSPFSSDFKTDSVLHDSDPTAQITEEPADFTPTFSSVPSSVSYPSADETYDSNPYVSHHTSLPLPPSSPQAASNPLLSAYSSSASIPPAEAPFFDTPPPKAPEVDDFYLQTGFGGLKLTDALDVRGSTDNASIPIPPSETGTIRSVDDEVDSRNTGALNSFSAWSQEPPSVTTTSNGNGATFFDPLQLAALEDDDPLRRPAAPPVAVSTNIRGSFADAAPTNPASPFKNGVESSSPVTSPSVAYPGTFNLSNEHQKLEATEHDFEISVSEPQKIGDPLSAHVSYKVRTKTNAPGFRNLDFTVSRRYRDFLWLYNQLTNRYPGVIIPPVPEKHAIGRFQDDFVESRRFALERCVRKIVSHPLLQLDEDVKLFLESESFAVDKRRDESAKGGIMAALNTAMSTAAAITPRELIMIRDQVDAIEGQLRSLLRALETLSKYRKDLGAATFDFGESMLALASVEVNKPVSNNLVVLGNIQKKIKEIHDKQAKQDMYHIISVVDEHIRIISSIKNAFNSRLKTYQTWQTAESNFIRKKELLDRIKSTAKVRSDKISVGSAEVTELEKQVQQNRRQFEDVSTLLRLELERYEKEKIVDFTIAIQGFLRSLIDTQKEIISLWQTYQSEATQTLEPVPAPVQSHNHWNSSTY
ncbi:Vps5 C terminal like-domain-containing protein [Chytridium lagenaria]|nr:Vps5 C terminal like-domain-containing protein [Chytridium lagenaria]